MTYFLDFEGTLFNAREYRAKQGSAAAYLYGDVPEFLKHLGNEALIITAGTESESKVPEALAGAVRLTVLYTGDQSKAEFLSTWPGYYGQKAVFVDDDPAQLELLARTSPNLLLYEMRRDGATGNARFPVVTSLNELP